jgi:hypothetical protein
MNPEDVAKLRIRLRDAVVERGPGARVAVAGWSPAAFEIAADAVFSSGGAEAIGILPATVAARSGRSGS